MESKKIFVDEMNKLNMLFDLSDEAFNNYLQAKFYLHALCIFKSNQLSNW